MPEEAMSVDASVSRWLKVRGVAGAMVRLAPPALGSGTGLSVPAALPAAVVDDTHLQANPSARLQTQLNDVRQRVMLLESELDITQQDATTFRSAFEGGEQELKAAQDAKVDALTLVAGESLGLALIFFVALLSWLMMSFSGVGKVRRRLHTYAPRRRSRRSGTSPSYVSSMATSTTPPATP
jgi:hypothetical protein